MSFFSKEYNSLVFEAFGSYHIIFILSFALVCLLTILFRKRIRASKYEWMFRLVPVLITVAFELVFKVWSLSKGEGIIGAVITFDLCAISLYLSWILFYNKRKALFRLTYFFALGALASIIYPDFGIYGPDHMRFYHYFIVHFFIIWAQLYFIAVHKFTVSVKDLNAALRYLTVIAVLVLLFNLNFNTNFMFLIEKPDISTPLNFFGEWPYYLVGLTIMVIVIFSIAYLPWIPFNSKTSKNK